MGIRSLRYHDLHEKNKNHLLSCGFSIEVAQLGSVHQLDAIWQVYIPNCNTLKMLHNRFEKASRAESQTS